MFAKSAFVVRSLFVAAVLGSLVACTFEQPSSGEDKGNAASALDGRKSGKKASGDAAVDPVAYANDASFDDNDASCACDGDGGVAEADGGPFDGDGGVSDNDAGWAGDDDDQSSDGGIYDDHDAGF